MAAVHPMLTPRRPLELPPAGQNPYASRGLRSLGKKVLGPVVTKPHADFSRRAATASPATAAATLTPRAATAAQAVGNGVVEDTAWYFHMEPSYGPNDSIFPIMEKIQAYVFQRRIRMKERYQDFDPLRSGRCTAQRFVRALNVLAPCVTLQEAQELVDHYHDNAAQQLEPQVINYFWFCREVDEVFALWELEKTPIVKVPRPGATVQRSHVGAATSIHGLGGMAPEEEEIFFASLLKRIALLARTRGVIFRSCFQDCDRSDSTSLTTPRYSGKVTPAQFRQHFPFIKDFSEEEVELLLKRYSTNGDVHFLALDKDLSEVPLDSPLVLPQNRWRLGGCGYISSSDRPSPHATRRWHIPEDAVEAVVMDKLRERIAERRLRMRELFGDFDKLRRGVCAMHQVKTVFTVLGIELDPQEFDALGKLYSTPQGMFRYREFSHDMSEAPFMPATPGSTMTGAEIQPTLSVPSSASPSRERQRAMLGPSAQAGLDEIEVVIRKRVQQRTLPIKNVFQDFDRVRSGRVTRTQFSRILDMLDIKLSEKEVELLCEAYCDPETRWEVKYLDFCAAVDIRWAAYGSTVKQPSKYFTRSGQVVPHPLLLQRPSTR